MPDGQICNVLVNEDDPDLSINFKYVFDSNQRLFTLKRKQKEALFDFSKRLKLNIEKISKKSKKNVESRSVLIEISFYQNEVEVKDLNNTTNQAFWVEGSRMKINDHIYKVHLNLPTVTNIRLSNVILSDFRMFPSITILNGNVKDSLFTWYRRKHSGINKEWKTVGTGFTQSIKESYIDYDFRIVCTPSNGIRTGLDSDAISANPVTRGPMNCPFMQRDIGRVQSNPIQFRVVSYNLLADIYAGTNYSATNLFPYCQTKYLYFDYRKLIIVEELLYYKADIYFLQEVDRTFFENSLNPIFLNLNYQGKFNCKKEMVEGLAIIFSDNYVCLKEESHNIGELILNSNQFTELRSKIETNDKLFKKITKLKNSFQILLLRRKEERKLLLVANLHLYSQDVADLIRLLQSYICLKYLEQSNELVRKEFKDHQVSLIVSGDFNSTPEFAVVKLATKQKVDSSLEDFRTSKEDSLDDLVLEQSLKLESACGYPDYTNYTQGFVGCLDYIFYDVTKLKVVKTIPFPKHEDVTRDVAIPSEVFPSDHIALGCIFQYN